MKTPAVALLLATVAAPVAGAQGWPTGGIVAAAGISAIDGKGASVLVGGVTRSWGPVVGSLFGDLSIEVNTPQYPKPSIDPLNAQVYCRNRPATSANVVCPAEIAAVGGGGAELGLALGRVVLGRGYRVSPVSEAYFAATFHGSTSKQSVRWLARAAVGPRMSVFAGGIVVDLDLARP